MQTVEQRVERLEKQIANYQQCFTDLYAANDAINEGLNTFRNEIRTALDTATVTFRDLGTKGKVIDDAVARGVKKLGESLQIIDSLKQRLQLAADTLNDRIVVVRPASRDEVKKNVAIPTRNATKDELR